MTDPNVSERMAELGRASGRARRARRSRTWEEAFTQLLDQAPDEVAARLVASGNSMALVEAIKLATDGRASRLRAREHELIERERKVRAAERDLGDFAAWEESAQSQFERTTEEIAELERARDQLRALVEAEGREAGYAMDVVE